MEVLRQFDAEEIASDEVVIGTAGSLTLCCLLFVTINEARFHFIVVRG
jgi:hypothetical protein